MNDEWRTPEWVFKLAHKIEPKFIFDAACTPENCLVQGQVIFGDSLSYSWAEYWGGAVWCNPPYSRGNIHPFIEKGLHEARVNSIRSVYLVRCDPTSKWFKRAFESGYCDISLISKRIKFIGADNTYPFPNCFIHFTDKDNKGNVRYVE